MKYYQYPQSLTLNDYSFNWSTMPVWFVFNNVNSGNGNFEHSRLDYYITKQ